MDDLIYIKKEKTNVLVNNDEINKFEKKIEKSIDFFIVKILLNFAFKRKILNFQT